MTHMEQECRKKEGIFSSGMFESESEVHTEQKGRRDLRKRNAE